MTVGKRPSLRAFLWPRPSATEQRPSRLEAHLRQLEAHLSQEYPALFDVVQSFRKLDEVAYRLGILSREESFATRVPWWPVIAVLGTFSSGKSSFINHFLQEPLQATGNQAVDDKFTALCFGPETRTLPGLALDADPRFAFYQISRAIENETTGEGGRINAYLQLKTCQSDALLGKIFIDSPGFDADEQRATILGITNHIIELSDLVLVFFDAGHPESKAMRDTLDHLVRKAIHRPDSNKFLYILNKIDNAAREDNFAEVFAAWQRALAQAGLTAGRFYSLYNPWAAQQIDNPATRQRFEAIREKDSAEVYQRIHQVETEREYRVIGELKKTAEALQTQVMPAVASARALWQRRVVWADATVLGVLIALAVWAEYWPEFQGAGLLVFGVVVLGCYFLHRLIRQWVARFIQRRLARKSYLADLDDDTRKWVDRAFKRNTRPRRPILVWWLAGWGRDARRRIEEVVGDADRFIKRLNDRFTAPTGQAPRPADSAAGRPGRLKPEPDTDEPQSDPPPPTATHP